MVVPMLTFAQEKGLDQKIDAAFQPVSDFFSNLIFFTIPIVGKDVPFVLLLLVGSALFFTIYFKFPNIFHFKTAINVVRGKYDELDQHEAGDPALAIGGDIKGTIKDESTEGEVTHFQALRGPGATFWMIICGLLGMSTKFVECTLGVQYRDVGEDGTVYGGPMYYLSKGLKEKGFESLGKIAAVIFAICCIGGSFGGGNAAQSNQATVVVKQLLGLESTSAGAIIGVVMAILVGIIIIGGIKRIARYRKNSSFYGCSLFICLYVYIVD